MHETPPARYHMQATMDVPANGRLLPVATIEAVGNRVIGASLKACAAPFLNSLAADYDDWAHGRPRKAGTLDVGVISEFHPVQSAQAVAPSPFVAGAALSNVSRTNDSMGAAS